jgi:hypothetical protein
MSEYRPQSNAGKLSGAARGCNCARALLGLAVLTLLGACDALAGDAATEFGARPYVDDLRTPAVGGTKSFVGPLFAPPLSLSMPGSYALPDPVETKSYSPKDFRPRGRSVLETDPRGPTEENLAFDATIWQRLNEYRNRDKIRVLTLWESGASTVSLQADHKGGPSLQWTSRLMNRGGATHGLLDRLFPVSIFGNGTSHSLATRSTSTSPLKAANPLGMPRSAAPTP